MILSSQQYQQSLITSCSNYLLDKGYFNRLSWQVYIYYCIFLRSYISQFIITILPQWIYQIIIIQIYIKYIDHQIALLLHYSVMPNQLQFDVAAYNYSLMQIQKDKVIYFRRKNKTSYAVNFKKNITYRSLQLLLSKREGIQTENITLIHHGNIIQSPFSFEQMQNKSIIHVIDMSDVRREFLQLHFKHLDNTTKKFKVRSQTIIQQFIKNNLAKIDQTPYFYLGLIYGGKMLSPSKTFFEEYVQNQCQIIIVDINDYLNKKPKQKNQIELNSYNPQKDMNAANQDKIRPSNQDKLFSSNQELKPITYKIDSLTNNVKTVSQQTQPTILKDENANSQNRQNHDSQDIKEIQDPPPPFNIRVSQVHSVSTEEDQRNHVSFNQNYPFQTIPSSNQQNTTQDVFHNVKQQQLGESELMLNDFIFIGSEYENQSKSFIQKLMKKYRIVLQPKP